MSARNIATESGPPETITSEWERSIPYRSAVRRTALVKSLGFIGNSLENRDGRVAVLTQLCLASERPRACGASCSSGDRI